MRDKMAYREGRSRPPVYPSEWAIIEAVGIFKKTPNAISTDLLRELNLVRVEVGDEGGLSELLSDEIVGGGTQEGVRRGPCTTPTCPRPTPGGAGGGVGGGGGGQEGTDGVTVDGSVGVVHLVHYHALLCSKQRRN